MFGAVLSRISVAAIACLALSANVRAAEVCISCEQPDATYRCSLDKAAEIDSIGIDEKWPRRICKQVLAKAGGHAKCRVIAKEGEPCDGVARVIGLDDLHAARSGPVDDSTRVPSLGERAGDAAESMGSTVTAGAKKSWDCVASFFQEC